MLEVTLGGRPGENVAQTQGGPESQSHWLLGAQAQRPHSPDHGVRHFKAAVFTQLERCCERAQQGPVHSPVGAACQAENEPQPLELQEAGGGGAQEPPGPLPRQRLRLGPPRSRGQDALGLAGGGDPGPWLAALSLRFPCVQRD